MTATKLLPPAQRPKPAGPPAAQPPDPTPWRLDAACRRDDTARWFPDRDDDINAALAVCARCPVAQQCLDDAVDAGPSRVGVWGGTTEQERAAIRVGRTPRRRISRRAVDSRDAKWCRQCDRILPLAAFGAHRGRPDGLNPTCRTCHARAERERKDRRDAVAAASSRALTGRTGRGTAA